MQHFRRYEDNLKKDCFTWSDKIKKFDYFIVNSEPLNMKSMLITRLKNLGDIKFLETTFLLIKIFGAGNWLFKTRWQCFNLNKKDADD